MNARQFVMILHSSVCCCFSADGKTFCWVYINAF